MTGAGASPILVYGAPRSGTTYLVRMLNEHPHVFVGNEMRVFGWLHQSLNVLTHDSRLVRRERERFVEYLRSEYPRLIRGFFRTLHPEVRYWGDKNPNYAWNHAILDTVIELFPESRFIHIVRDGRDVVISLVRQGQMGFDRAHSVWMTHVDGGRSYGRNHMDRYREVRYEELVRDDVGAARELFEFLGIDMHPDVLAFCEAQRSRRTPISSPSRDLREGALISDWHRLLPPDQKLHSLELLGNHLVRYRYETAASVQEAKGLLEEKVDTTPVDPLRSVVQTVVPRDATIAVVSGGDDRFLLLMDGRRAWHFPQSQAVMNRPLGHDPASSREAITELEQMRERGARFLMVPSAASGWLERFGEFREHLDETYRRAWSDEHCLLYALNGGG